MPYISGWKTPNDWTILRDTLVVGATPDVWQRAFEEFFKTRLDLRYFNQIRLMQEYGSFQGEGFSILAIQCTLIEFLESTVGGLTYRYLRRGERLDPFEYNMSSSVFISCLTGRHPFKHHFDPILAKDFYENIRCGLLHEARTNDGWRIWAEGEDDEIVDRERKIVYRDGFQSALNKFIEWYRIELPKDIKLQEAFIRKFNSLV